MAPPYILVNNITLLFPIEKHFFVLAVAPFDLIANSWLCDLRVSNNTRLNSLHSHSVEYIFSCNERTEKYLSPRGL